METLLLKMNIILLLTFLQGLQIIKTEKLYIVKIKLWQQITINVIN